MLRSKSGIKHQGIQIAYFLIEVYDGTEVLNSFRVADYVTRMRKMKNAYRISVGRTCSETSTLKTKMDTQ